MRLSTKGRYGLKIMYYLAKYSSDQPTPSFRNCRKYGASWKLFRTVS